MTTIVPAICLYLCDCLVYNVLKSDDLVIFFVQYCVVCLSQILSQQAYLEYLAVVLSLQVKRRLFWLYLFPLTAQYYLSLGCS